MQKSKHSYKTNKMRKSIGIIMAICLIIGGFFCLFKVISAYEGMAKEQLTILKDDNAEGEEQNTALEEENTEIEEPQTEGIFGEYEELAKEKLKTLSLEEKVGQIFLARCPSEGALEEIKTIKPGGYILFGRDFAEKNKEQVIQMIGSYQQASAIPMLIGVDEEGGSVVRISSNQSLVETRFKSPQELYALGGLDAVRQDALNKSESLKALGINLNLAPVADVSVESTDYIYARSFGKEAKQTAEYVDCVIKAMNEGGMAATLKHFPGYGNNIDTHTGIAVDERPYDQFIDNDWLPFKSGIEAGVESILISHNIVKSMDDKLPASLSPKIHQLLRETLGFEGVIMTDDLAMQAIMLYIGEEDPSVMAIKGGNDLIIITDLRVGYDAILAAVKQGEIAEERIDASVIRILAWKYKMGLRV